MAPLKIIVIGGGIGGPAAAAGLARNGHHVTLYEQSTKPAEVGFAFRITPNSDICLKELGIDAVAGGAVPAHTWVEMDCHGKVIGHIDENTDEKANKTGMSLFAYRPHLNKQLLDVAISNGTVVKNGVAVVRVDVDNTAVELAGGEKLSADLIVGADGVHSMARKSVVDTSVYYPTPSTGHNALRFMLSTEAMKNDELAKSLVDDKANMFTWNGQNKRIIGYPADFGRQCNIVCTHPQELSDGESLHKDSHEAVSYNQKASLETVDSIFAEYEPRARQLLKLADTDGFRLWKLADLDELPRWSVNSTVLIGDAAHAVLPFGFSGASMSIEDGLTLSILFGEDVAPGDTQGIKKRLALFERMRKPRVDKVRDTSRLLGTSQEDDDHVFGDHTKFVTNHNPITYAKQIAAEEL